MDNNVKIFISVIGILILGVVGMVVLRSNEGKTSTPGKYDVLAQCLKDKGAVFYGAFWCPHCQNTKKSFGNAAQYLNYVECSTPDSKGQTQACIDAGIKGYPTWEFPDGSRLEGEIPMATLAEKSMCTLPE